MLDDDDDHYYLLIVEQGNTLYLHDYFGANYAFPFALDILQNGGIVTVYEVYRDKCIQRWSNHHE